MIKLVLYDKTDKGAAGGWWPPGVRAFKALGMITDGHGVGSWTEALDWLYMQTALAEEAGQPITQIEFWGHGSPGRAWIKSDKLSVGSIKNHMPRTRRIKPHLRDCTFWLRTCSSFAGTPGHAFARSMSDYLGCTVAGHTHVIGPLQSGLHTLRSGETPDWSTEEGQKNGRIGKAFSYPWSPNTIPAWVNRIPETW